MTIKLTRLDLDYILDSDPDGRGRPGAGQSRCCRSACAKSPAPTTTSPRARAPSAPRCSRSRRSPIRCSRTRRAAPATRRPPASWWMRAAHDQPARRRLGMKILSAGADGINGTADDVVQGNPAAIAAQQTQLGQLGDGYLNLTLPGADGIYGTADDTGTLVAGPDGVLGTADDFVSFGNHATPTNAANSSAIDPGAGTEPVHSQHHAGRRSVGAGQQLLHVLRPVLRPWPRPDRQERRQRHGLHSAAAGRPAVRAGQPRPTSWC